MDIFGSLALFLVFGAPMLLIAALIRLTSPGHALFKQRRSGLYGREFTMYKFRSMAADAEQRRAELEALNEMTGPAFKTTTRAPALMSVATTSQSVSRARQMPRIPDPVPMSQACRTFRRRPELQGRLQDQFGLRAGNQGVPGHPEAPAPERGPAQEVRPGLPLAPASQPGLHPVQLGPGHRLVPVGGQPCRASA